MKAILREPVSTQVELWMMTYLTHRTANEVAFASLFERFRGLGVDRQRCKESHQGGISTRITCIDISIWYHKLQRSILTVS